MGALVYGNGFKGDAVRSDNHGTIRGLIQLSVG